MDFSKYKSDWRFSTSYFQFCKACLWATWCVERSQMFQIKSHSWWFNRSCALWTCLHLVVALGLVRNLKWTFHHIRRYSHGSCMMHTMLPASWQPLSPRDEPKFLNGCRLPTLWPLRPDCCASGVGRWVYGVLDPSTFCLIPSCTVWIEPTTHIGAQWLISGQQIDIPGVTLPSGKLQTNPNLTY